MKEQFLEIRNYINNISYYDSSENREYDHYPYLIGVLENFTPKQQDNFVEEVFTWYDHELDFVADCLNFTDYELKGRYESSYVFCKCFAKIDNVEYLEYLYQDLELHLMQRKFFKNHLSLPIQDIINNLYLLINHLRDENSIDFCLKMIEDLKG